MSTNVTDSMGDQFADIMARTAIRYLVDVQHIPKTDVDVKLLSDLLRKEVPGTLKEAMDDGRAAVEAGMSGWAGKTFAASASLGGIRAGKAYVAAKGGA